MWRCMVALAALMLAACTQPATVGRTALSAGASAPAFSLKGVRGEQVDFAADAPTLISFVAAQPHVEGAPDPSRSQVVFLQSMQQQFEPRGLRVLLVAPSTRQSAELLNLSYDWDLRVPLLIDSPQATTAQAYGVEQLPTTFLVNQHGQIIERWNGSATAAQLGLAIQALLDSPTP